MRDCTHDYPAKDLCNAKLTPHIVFLHKSLNNWGSILLPNSSAVGELKNSNEIFDKFLCSYKG